MSCIVDVEIHFSSFSLQPDAGHIGAPFLRQRNGKGFASEAKDNLQSSVSTSRSGFLRKV